MHGRGYVSKGDSIAASYISNKFREFQLYPFQSNFNYYQKFKLSVNTFPGAVECSIDGKLLKPGIDYLVNPSSTSINGEYSVFWLDKNIIHSRKRINALNKISFKDKVIIVDREGMVEKKNKGSRTIQEQMDFVKAGVFNNPASGWIEPKLTWAVSQHQGFPMLTFKKGAVSRDAKTIKLKIEQQFIPEYETQNVIGLIEGEKIDSILLISAHYDHLGRMGSETIFPGANDNASGISMLLDLAAYYSKHKPEYNTVFIAFAAEEAGLVGSDFFVQNPLFPLEKIKFMINLDLVGTGEEGITVVNATEQPAAFEKLTKINAEKNYLTQIKSRGKAANSDHYYFSEKGVPAFFIYTMGGVKHYHDIYDRPETLPLTEYNDVFRLITDFIKTL